MEHQDKGKFYGIGTKPTQDIPPELLTGETKDQKDKRLWEESKARRAKAFVGKKEELEKQYSAFLNDNSNLKAVEAQGISWGSPGLIVEVFVADYTTNTGLLIEDDLYKKFTPFAKILSASKWNTGPKAEWKAGDVIHIGDAYMAVQVNPMWSAWQEGQKSNQKLMGVEPTQYIRKLYSWIVGGKLYTPHKADFLLDNDMAILSESTIKKFNGPYCFLIDEYELVNINLKIEGNPWA